MTTKQPKDEDQSAIEQKRAERAERLRKIKLSPSYRQAHLDPDFIGCDELRPLRLQL
jgi:hypothetical protein